jgi:hypothetical protein
MASGESETAYRENETVYRVREMIYRENETAFRVIETSCSAAMTSWRVRCREDKEGRTPPPRHPQGMRRKRKAMREKRQWRLEHFRCNRFLVFN